MLLQNDELKIYRGEDFVVRDKSGEETGIIIHQCTLGEICDYSERDYYTMINSLCATPQSMKWQLWEQNIDYTEIKPYELFYKALFNIYSKDKTAILFGDLDFQNFVPMISQDNEVFLCQQTVDENGSIKQYVIDEYVYDTITDYLRQVHSIEKDERIPANETTKMILIEDAKDEYEMTIRKPYHSFLKPLVSSMVNSEGFKYNHSQVWDMKINAFMDSVMRIQKIKNANLLLQSGYSGFGVDLNKISKKQLDWLGEV